MFILFFFIINECFIVINIFFVSCYFFYVRFGCEIYVGIIYDDNKEWKNYIINNDYDILLLSWFVVVFFMRVV